MLHNNYITQEEYDQKIEEAKQLMIANNFQPKISVVNDKTEENPQTTNESTADGKPSEN